MLRAYPVDGRECKNCGEEELMYQTKEEATGFKVYAVCDACGRDFGRVGFVSLADVDSQSEIDAQAETLAKNFAGA